MQELAAHAAVQAGAAPFLAGLIAALVLSPLRLSGLAAGAGFFAAVFLTGALDFDKRLVVAAVAAPLVGALADLALRPTRAAGFLLGIGFGLAAVWIFLFVPYALWVGALVAATVAFTVLSQHEPARVGAAGVALGVAVGVAAFLGGARLFSLWSFGLAAGCAGFLVAALMPGQRLGAGVSFALSVGAIGALMAAAVVVQRWLPWYYAALFALIPLAVRLPAPVAPGAQALVALFYALAAAAGICALPAMR